jgi:tetratricopeptide (TPR) repeat protein
MKRSRLEKLKELVQKRSDDPFSHYALALEYKNEGMFEDALEEFQSLVDDYPDYVPVYYQFGVLLTRLNKVDRAREVLTVGISVAVQQGNAHASSELSGALEQLPK